MLAHLTERVIVKDKDGQLPERDCLTVVNATQNALQPLLSSSACEVKVIGFLFKSRIKSSCKY